MPILGDLTGDVRCDSLRRSVTYRQLRELTKASRRRIRSTACREIEALVRRTGVLGTPGPCEMAQAQQRRIDEILES